ncbi:RIN4, pathogenic type III effector avirulence factor Avr cleavage site [Sesbania bispinosa]|nr:RIN4, pathogenic type III effector avirulence factor Avr cleavage site [Sesbania bispinosa]
MFKFCFFVHIQQDKGRPLPKFGEWDVNNPASAEGFTVIFNKARDEKKTNNAPMNMGLGLGLVFQFPSHKLYLISEMKFKCRGSGFAAVRRLESMEYICS